MIFPYVSRAEYDAVVRMQDKTIERLSVELQSMTARYHQLRLQGFTEPKPQPAPVPAPAPDPVGNAIVRMAGSNRALADAMWKRAELDRATMSDEDIAQAIYQGTSTSERVSL